MFNKTSLNRLDYAWTGLPLEAVQEYLSMYNSFNPFDNRMETELENKGLREIILMYDVDYIWYTCKVLLNIELHSMQCVILKQFFMHSFPMLVGSRGLGKSFLLAVYALLRAILFPGSKIVITGAAFRQSKLVFDYLEDIFNNSPILQSIYKGNKPTARLPDFWTFYLGDSKIIAVPTGCLTEDTFITTENGIRYIKDLKEYNGKVWSINKYKKIGFFHDNGIKQTWKINTNLNLEIKGTLNHKLKVVENNEVVWKELQNIEKGDRLVIDISERWFEPNFKCTVDEAYCLGLMIGDGSYRQKYKMKFTTKDSEVVEYLNKNIGEFKNYGDLNYHYCSKQGIENWLKFWNLSQEIHVNKCLPNTILSASKEAMKACLQGLFDTDGSVSYNYTKGGLHSSVSFTTTSKVLAEQIQYILTHFSIICNKQVRQRPPTILLNRKNITYPRVCYDLYLNGKNIIKFYEQIGFRITRKQKKLEYIINNKKRIGNISYDIPVEKSLLLWISNHYKLGSIFTPCKVSEKKKITFNYLSKFYSKCVEKQVDEEYLKDIKILLNPDFFYSVVKSSKLFEELPTYDVNIPEDNTYIANGFISHNTGEKIRGLRGHVICCDEFNSISTEVYEIVISQFAAVAASPIENIKKLAKQKIMREENIEINEVKSLSKVGNQSIISGTMRYQFEPMAIYWKKYKDIIESKGRNLEEQFGELADSLNYKDFCIIRIPFELCPVGFMDEKIVARSRSVMHEQFYQAEFGCCPISDSMGFFKRTLIQSCTATNRNVNTENWPIWCAESFDVKLRGDNNKSYVMGIDPAYNQDNLAIIILELWPEHSRIVYGWSTSKRTFNSSGEINEKNYFNFCARKIRNLIKNFNITGIALDTQGGGYNILEALQDDSKLEPGEIPLRPVIPDKKQDTDGRAGSHIITLFQFSDAELVTFSNQGMKKDMEDKVLLFPEFNSVLLGLASEKEKNDLVNKGHSTDSLEDCMLEIEELKDELSIIMHSTTPAGRQRWDTPEIKLSTTKKDRMRKDRYSALLMANYLARSLARTLPGPDYGVLGAAVGTVNRKVDRTEKLYSGPEWMNASARLFRGIVR